MADSVLPELHQRVSTETVPRKRYRPQHGFSSSAEYQAWMGAIHRTTNKKNKRYESYGGRGIFVCESWLNDFMAFLKDMGPRPPGTSLDRIDNDGPYSPENCRWATPSEQARNRRPNGRQKVLIRIGDAEKTSTEWSLISGIPEKRIWKRFYMLGWPAEEAVFTPVLKTWSNRKKR